MPARRVSTAGRTERFGGRDAVGEWIGRHEHGDAGAQKKLYEQETDRATAVDACRRARPHMTEVERVQRHPEWLEQRRLDVGNRVGQVMGETFRPRQAGAQSTVDRVPGKPAGDAEVLVARDARRADATCDRRVEGNPLARPRSRLDHADELVAENERPRQDDVADGALVEPVQIGAAEPDGSDAHENLVVTRRRHRLLVESQVALVVKAQRDHRGCP